MQQLQWQDEAIKGLLQWQERLARTSSSTCDVPIPHVLVCLKEFFYLVSWVLVPACSFTTLLKTCPIITFGFI